MKTMANFPKQQKFNKKNSVINFVCIIFCCCCSCKWSIDFIITCAEFNTFFVFILRNSRHHLNVINNQRMRSSEKKKPSHSQNNDKRNASKELRVRICTNFVFFFFFLNSCVVYTQDSKSKPYQWVEIISHSKF